MTQSSNPNPAAEAPREMFNINMTFDSEPKGPTKEQIAQAIIGQTGALMEMLRSLPPSREFSLAITKAEECAMWGIQGINTMGAKK